jgi:hypothetical protein
VSVIPSLYAQEEPYNIITRMCKMNINAQPAVTLSDFLIAHANVFSIDNEGRTDFTSKNHESEAQKTLLSIFRAPHTLRAVKDALPPLIPGNRYFVSQIQSAQQPDGIILVSKSEDRGSVCLSLMEFFNSFHDQHLPEFESMDEDRGELSYA